MNPDQLADHLLEVVATLNGVVQATPGLADCSVKDLIEYLGLTNSNQVQLLAIHAAMDRSRVKTAAPAVRRQQA